VKLSILCKKINEMSDVFVGDIYIPSMIRKLNAKFNTHKVYFISNRFVGKSYKNHSVIVSAEYCPKIVGIPEHIIISLSFPKYIKKISLSKRGADILIMKLHKIFYHELRHKEQYKRKKIFFCGDNYIPPKTVHKGIRDKLYYFGSSDEIDAHAYETIVDFAYGKLNINKLRCPSNITWRESEAIFLYNKYFYENDIDVWKKFMRKVYKNIR